MDQLLTHVLKEGFLAKAEESECYCVVITVFDPRSGRRTVAECYMPPTHAQGLLDKLVTGGTFTMRGKNPPKEVDHA